MQLLRLHLTRIPLNNIYRNYVSVVSINVNSFRLIKVNSRDTSDSSEEVKLTLIDDKRKEVEVSSVKSLSVVNTKDEFKIDCGEPNSLSATLLLPVVSQEAKIAISAQNSNIQVENIQAKSFDIQIKAGDSALQGIKGESIKVEVDKGNISSVGQLLAESTRLISRSGYVAVAKPQGQNPEIEAESIKVGGCYSHNNKFTSTSDALLKNVHGNSVIKSSGKKFRLSGFSGTLQAHLDNEEIEMQLSKLTGDNLISSINPNAEIKLGLHDDVIKQTNIKITSDCNIDSYVDELMTCHRGKRFEIIKENYLKNNLQVNVTKGKLLEVYKQSWIDFFKTI